MVFETVKGGVSRFVVRKIVMRMAWYIYVAAFIWLLGAPSLMGQEFLKQLEQKLFQKQQESKSKEPNSEPGTGSTLEFPTVPPPEVLPDLIVHWKPCTHFLDRVVHPRAELTQKKPEFLRTPGQ